MFLPSRPISAAGIPHIRMPQLHFTRDLSKSFNENSCLAGGKDSLPSYFSA
jgi:hypothetical protein